MNDEKKCPIDYALEIFGDRWTLLVLRDLVLGGKRNYRHLITLKEGIASNILASRLRKMETDGLIVRSVDAEDKRQVFYEPTEKALDLIPILLEIGRWSAKYDKNTAAPPDLLNHLDKEWEQLISDLKADARTRQA